MVQQPQQNGQSHDGPTPGASGMLGFFVTFGLFSIVGLIVYFAVFPAVTEDMTDICVNNISPKHDRIDSDIPIYSLEDDLGVHGSFFLGTGRVDSIPVYLFYTGNDHEGFQRTILEQTDNVYVFRDSEYAHLVRKTKWKMTPMSGGPSICGPVKVIEVHVPRNTEDKQVVL